jgi:hypothetical protein
MKRSAGNAALSTVAKEAKAELLAMRREYES